MQKKVICLFPGQGIKINYEDQIFQTSLAEQCIDKINNMIQDNIKEGSSIVKTQLSIILASYLLFQTIKDEIVCVAGHSLGQYSAAIACRTINFEEAIQLVYTRAKFMTDNIKLLKNGHMIACINSINSISIDQGTLEQKLLMIINSNPKFYNKIFLANYNSQNQIVVGGIFDDYDNFNMQCRQYNIKCIKLEVAGPFHTPFMLDANQKMNSFIKSANFSKPKYSFILNKSIALTKSEDLVKEDFIDQIILPVRWDKCLNITDQIEHDFIIEVNSISTLNKFLKPSKVCRNIREIINAN